MVKFKKNKNQTFGGFKANLTFKRSRSPVFKPKTVCLPPDGGGGRHNQPPVQLLLLSCHTMALNLYHLFISNLAVQLFLILLFYEIKNKMMILIFKDGVYKQIY